MHWPNLDQLSPHDEVKFVIADRARLRVRVRRRRALRPARRARGRAVLAGARRARARTRAVDSRRAACRCGCSCRRTSTSGARTRGGRSDRKRAVVLLSGRPDSTTAAALARREGWELYGLTLRLRPGARREIEAARRVAASLGFVAARRARRRSRGFGGSSLVGDGEMPTAIAVARDADFASVPSTYVPARNTVLLSLALAWAEVLGAERIVIGVNALDYSGYPDCRPEFIARLRVPGDSGDEGRRRRAALRDLGAAAASDQGRDHPRRPRARRRLRPDAQLLRPGRRRPAVRAVRQLPAARARVCGSRRDRPAVVTAAPDRTQ